MSVPVLRLPNTAQCLVLDPRLGPVPRPLVLLAPGDAVLAESEGVMCFRPVSRAEPVPPPSLLALLPRDSLGTDRPTADLILPDAQQICLPQAGAEPIPVAQIALPAPVRDHAAPDGWMRIIVEGATRLVVDGIGLIFAEPQDDRTKRAELADIIALRAYAGQTELPLIAAEPMPGGAELHFTVPARTAALRLISQTFRAEGDYRQLGVALVGLAVEQSAIGLDNPGLVRGFYPVERNDDTEWRWTDGEALLLLPPRPTQQTLEVRITDWHATRAG